MILCAGTVGAAEASKAANPKIMLGLEKGDLITPIAGEDGVSDEAIPCRNVIAPNGGPGTTICREERISG